MEDYNKYKMIPKEILLSSAKLKGLRNKEHIEKDYFQDILLYYIFKKTNLLIFKGGTALYKIYNLRRFSEDLDFSLLKEFDVEKKIKEAVSEINGAKIKEIKKTKTSYFFKISFDGILTAYNTVRIDISITNPLLEDFELKNYISNYIDIPPFTMRVMSLNEILSEKIHAIFARQKARDLYDLFFLVKFVEVDKKIIITKLDNLNVKYTRKKLEVRLKNLKLVWEKELKHFILDDVPDFQITKDFVLSKIKF